MDEFNSPWIRAYFDVGNVAFNGYPHDWIRTLGKRIVKLHIKDFAFRKRVAEFTPLLEGEIDFKAVHQALIDIGYKGSATVELAGGDGEYLKEVQPPLRKDPEAARREGPRLPLFNIGQEGSKFD